jgi:hypothetical protein
MAAALDSSLSRMLIFLLPGSYSWMFLSSFDPFLYSPPSSFKDYCLCSLFSDFFPTGFGRRPTFPETLSILSGQKIPPNNWLKWRHYWHKIMHKFHSGIFAFLCHYDSVPHRIVRILRFYKEILVNGQLIGLTR